MVRKKMHFVLIFNAMPLLIYHCAFTILLSYLVVLLFNVFSVFDSCFSTNVLKWESYRQIAMHLRERFSDASFLVFNIGEDRESQLTDILSQYDITVMDYPKECMGCPILSLELICHFLHSADR